MTREFIRAKQFEKYWNDLGYSDEDLRESENFLMENPNAGDINPGTGGAVKLRWVLRSSDKGKSGGIRLICADLPYKTHTHFLLCYPKSVQETLTEDQKKKLKQLIKALKGE
jgi:hypothetical protein